MSFKKIAGGCLLAIALISPQLTAAADRPSKPANWSCDCRTYDGSPENCYMYATIRGRKFEFGAFETSGEGRWRMARSSREQVVTGDIRTQTGGKLRAIIVTPRGKAVSNVFIGDRSGDPLFTATCTGRL